MTVDELRHALEGRTRGTLRADFGLSALTTYRLGGPAALYFEPADTDDVVAFARALRDSGLETKSFPLLAMGRGSNLVVSDRGWPGVVVRLGTAFSWIRGGEELDREHSKYVRARAGATMLYRMDSGAATALPQLANWAARRSLAGMEFTVAIPGSVGGAVRMNAGAHGREIAEVLVAATVFDFDELVVDERPADDLDLAYRHSNLTDRQMVLEATFGLSTAPETDIRGRMEAYRHHRAETQPGAVQNAGSVFKNPSGDSAGRLVEEAGLKGFRVGGAAVSELHANFFIAAPGASSQDVYDLVHEVRRRVRDATGVTLEPEVRFVGEFASTGVDDG